MTPSERVVQAAHPELTPDDVRRTAEAYSSLSREYDGTVSEMAIQSRAAEQKSEAGGDIAV